MAIPSKAYRDLTAALAAAILAEEVWLDGTRWLAMIRAEREWRRITVERIANSWQSGQGRQPGESRRTLPPEYFAMRWEDPGSDRSRGPLR